MPATAELHLDLTEFRAAVEYVHEHTRRLMPDIVNRGALVAIIGGRGVEGVMQRTKKASRDTILAVPMKLIAGRVVSKHKGEKMSRDQMYDYIRKEVKRRIAAIGYTAYVGWNNAAIAFGGRGIRSQRASGIGYASEGYGSPAHQGQFPYLVAEMVNSAPAAAALSQEPLQAALDDAARDMTEYAGGKMQEILNPYNV